MEAGCVRVVEVGQYFMTKDTGDLDNFVQWLPRDDESSQQRGWIQGNSRIGSVLEVATGVNMELKLESGL